jgi:hypothetical protein
VREKAVLLLRERTELLRLTGMLYGFLRQVLREQRLGYPNDSSPVGLAPFTTSLCSRNTSLMTASPCNQSDTRGWHFSLTLFGSHNTSMFHVTNLTPGCE